MTSTQEWKIGDCLDLLPEIPDKSIDMILTDLPYGTTACSWDTVIPFEPLWEQYKRIIKDNGAIVLTAAQPFTSALIMSNIEMFKYEWIWNKSRPTGFFTADIMPMKIHENILVFGNGKLKYNPIKTIATRNIIDRRKTFNSTYSPYLKISKDRVRDTGTRFPITIQKFGSVSQKGQHPTQKPISLFEYLIKTYTNEGDTVHDSCLGSGTTLEACMNTNRNCIGFEISDEWECHYKKRLQIDNAKITDVWGTTELRGVLA